jgi:amino acid adenylation domain-containing protein
MPTLPDDSIDWAFEPFEQAVLDGSISDRFDAIARRYPTRLAITDLHGSLTYAELAGQVDAIAAAIAAATAERSGTVAILLANEARFPAAILGALAAARGCVPLAADDPVERNQMIAADALAAAVVSAGAFADHARRLFPELPVIDIETLRRDALTGPRRRPTGADLAYIIYTSGSTGKPKGVYQNHRGLLDDLRRAADSLHLSCDDRQALFYTPSLISGFRVALGSLLAGGSLHILPPRELKPAGLASAIRAQGITIFRAVPTLFRHVVEALGPDERLDSLRIVLLGGDRVEWRDFDACRRGCSPDCRFGMHLGATESSTLYLQWFVDERLRQSSPRLPVGRAMPGRSVRLVDESGNPVAEGEVGEFHVSGRHLALGYWRDPELTARAFASDPADPELRTYRTGDLGRKRPDGLYEFVGRKDQQIKLHGHRIEPGEIESALRTCASVRDAAVVVRRGDTGVPRALVAYAELDPETAEPLPRHLTAMLAERIPRHMMPSSIVIAKELPRLPNLKVDRVRLAEIDAGRVAADAAVAEGAPRTMLAAQLCALYARVTDAARVGAHDNFFELGGDSLTALLLITEIRQTLGHAVTLGDVFDHATPAALAEYLAAERPASPDDDTLPTLFVVPGAGGDSPRLQRLRQRCAHSMRIVMLEFPDWPLLVAPGFGTAQLIASLIEQIEAACGDGPILLAGYSVGGFIAYDVAQALADRRVGLLAIIDTNVTQPLVPLGDDPEASSQVGALHEFYWDIKRAVRPAMRGRRVENLALAIARLLTHPSGIPVLRRLHTLRRLRLPTRFRYFLHRWICEALHERYAAAWRAAHLAAPSPLDLPVAVFVGADPDAKGHRAADLGWGPHCRSLRIVAVDGDHATMFDEPQLGTLGTRFADVVAAAARPAAAPANVLA